MLTRCITGAILVLVLVPTTFFGNWPFFLLILFLAVVAIHEILVTPGPKRYNWFVKGVVYLFVLSFIYWTFLKNLLRDSSNPEYNNPFINGGVFSLTNLYVSITGIILYALVLFLIAIVDHKVQLQDIPQALHKLINRTFYAEKFHRNLQKIKKIKRRSKRKAFSCMNPRFCCFLTLYCSEHDTRFKVSLHERIYEHNWDNFYH